MDSPVTGQECLSWHPRAAAPMSPRKRHAMAYDLRRGVSVLFGGRYFSQPYGDTWEWDGSTWTERPVAGPEARSEHAMVYDRARRVTVLFGGAAVGSPPSLIVLGDTWEWDGDDWSLASIDGPTPRLRTALAFDVRRGVTVLFGGVGDGARIYGDTWEWDGSAWAIRSTSGPPSRAVASMAYDEDRGVVVLFGGANHTRPFGDTWEWDGSSWVHRTSYDQPSSRQLHRMVFDRGRGVTMLYGGWLASASTVFDDIWEWDGTTWTMSENAGPHARFGQSMTYDSRRGAITVFGGDPDLTDTWEFMTCLGDQDNDGVPDVDDECPDTVLSDTVIVGDCDTSVPDQVLVNGCCMSELIASCNAGRRNHGQAIRCVADLVRTWRRDGIFGPRDQRLIIQCAAGSAQLRTGIRRP